MHFSLIKIGYHFTLFLRRKNCEPNVSVGEDKIIAFLETRPILVSCKTLHLVKISVSRYKGSPTQIHAGGIWALPVRGGGSQPLPGWFGALFFGDKVPQSARLSAGRGVQKLKGQWARDMNLSGASLILLALWC